MEEQIQSGLFVSGRCLPLDLVMLRLIKWNIHLFLKMKNIISHHIKMILSHNEHLLMWLNHIVFILFILNGVSLFTSVIVNESQLDKLIYGFCSFECLYLRNEIDNRIFSLRKHKSEWTLLNFWLSHQKFRLWWWCYSTDLITYRLPIKISYSIIKSCEQPKCYHDKYNRKKSEEVTL